jgi:hypothetical protein
MAFFLFPFYTMIPTGVLGEEIRINAWVPVDTEHTMAWRLQAPSIKSATQAGFYGLANSTPAGAGNATRSATTPRVLDSTTLLPFLPDTSDWLGSGRLVGDKSNDYLIDRDAQKRMVTFSGINGGVNGTFLEDAAVTESMGQVYDRSREHLGTSDSMVIRTRRHLIRMAKAFSDEGLTPPGVDEPEVFAVRSGGFILPKSVDWWEGSSELRKAFVEHTDAGPIPLSVAR